VNEEARQVRARTAHTDVQGQAAARASPHVSKLVFSSVSMAHAEVHECFKGFAGSWPSLRFRWEPEGPGRALFPPAGAGLPETGLILCRIVNTEFI
jgi:hypothetical protein